MGSKAFVESILKHSGLYSIYERRLESQILKDSLPNHIAIILDGNRRWAKYNFVGINSGHFMGADKAEDLLNWIHDLSYQDYDIIRFIKREFGEKRRRTRQHIQGLTHKARETV